MKWHFASDNFGKMTFGKMIFQENDVRLNKDLEKCCSALWSSGNSTIRPCDDSAKWLSVIFFLQNNNSAKLQSAKRRFDEMTFRENEVAPGWVIIFNIVSITHDLGLPLTRSLIVIYRIFSSIIVAILWCNRSIYTRWCTDIPDTAGALQSRTIQAVAARQAPYI